MALSLVRSPFPRSVDGTRRGEEGGAGVAEEKPVARRSRAAATRTAAKKRIDLGFTSVREMLSYALGTGVLLYGVLEAAPDRQLIVVGAGLALLGAPVVGGIFEKKG